MSKFKISLIDSFWTWTKMLKMMGSFLCKIFFIGWDSR